MVVQAIAAKTFPRDLTNEIHSARCLLRSELYNWVAAELK